MANYILRPQEMKVWEAGIIRDGVDSLILMENAAKNMAAIIARHISPGRVGIFCGTGNNGGDGFALARHLLLAGFSPVLLLVGEADKLTPEARKNYEAARVLGILIIQCRQQVDFALGLGCDLLVDALFGTGLQRPIGGLYADAVQGINTAGKPVCAADIPSGIDADGQVLGCAVQADFTVTFQYKKSGLVLYPGRDYAGEVFVCDIGIPKMREQDFLWEQLEREDIGALLPERDSDSNKGDYGKLLVVAGSENMVGAAALCAKAAIRAGSGLTTIAAPQGITGMLHTMLWEAMSFDLPQQEGKIAEGCSRALLAAAAGKSAIAAGPGLGQSAGVEEMLETILCGTSLPRVLDADALNTLARRPDLLETCVGRTVITPHPGEMARLLDVELEEVLEQPANLALEFARQYGVVVALKGSTSVIAAPDGRLTVNTTGNPGMAKGGSGDVLCGMIGAFLARGLGLYDAARLGCFVGGLAGDAARESWGQHSMTASDMIDALGRVL